MDNIYFSMFSCQLRWHEQSGFREIIVFIPYSACLHSKGYMLMVSISGMTVSLKTDLRFPITGQQGHGSRNIHYTKFHTIGTKIDQHDENEKVPSLR